MGEGAGEGLDESRDSLGASSGGDCSVASS